MSTKVSPSVRPFTAHPTIWGLEPFELHDRFWASHGVFVVWAGRKTPIPRNAQLLMLIDSESLVMFDIEPVMQAMVGDDASLLLVRLRSIREIGYRESVLSDADGQFLRMKRTYRGAIHRATRLAFTKDRRFAEVWQNLTASQTRWRHLRRAASESRRSAAHVSGNSYDRDDDQDVARFVKDLIEHWPEPSATLPHVRELAPRVWACADVDLHPSVRFVGAAWVGAGRSLDPGMSVLGPAALWDDPVCRPSVGDVDWENLLPSAPLTFVRGNRVRPRGRRSVYHVTKRLFDIAASLLALAITLPLYPVIMFLIWWEDGRPFFYSHLRETVGGKEFPCIKFRSMRIDADVIKRDLRAVNKADGPQFYMPGDPRITKIGKRLRLGNIDEIPQFLNVLLGHMSIIGPRPSPHSENQCCPPWREARLSVRPGITGLWQVKRTRKPGLDFQEWIRYDLEYVEYGSWMMDLSIIFQTIKILLRR